MLRTPLAARPSSLRRAWAVAFVVLVAAYCAQELCEGMIAGGHPVGLAGVFGSGGWFALPLACVVALLVALGLRSGNALAPATEPLRGQHVRAEAIVLTTPAPGI